MQLNDYQTQSSATAIFDHNFATFYLALGLANEAGEVAGVVKKEIRDGGDPVLVREKIKAELGDTFWYLAQLAKAYDLTLKEVAQANLTKIRDRQQRGVIQGSGDNR